MTLHGFSIVEIPFHHQLALPIDIHMFWRMIAFPANKDVPATPQFSHPPLMLPATVTAVNRCQPRCQGTASFNSLVRMRPRSKSSNMRSGILEKKDSTQSRTKRYSDEWCRTLIVYSFTDHRLKHPAFIGILKRAPADSADVGRAARTVEKH